MERGAYYREGAYYSKYAKVNELHLGIDYHNVLDLKKRIHNGVIDRMEKTGGYSLPEFMVSGKPLWFAIDNKDFIEDTGFGKNILHGTVMVVWQKGDKGAEKINSPIEIPKKASRVRIQVDYLQEPKINPKAV